MKNSQIILCVFVLGFVLVVAVGVYGQRPQNSRQSPGELIPQQILAILGAAGENGRTPAMRESYRRIFARMDSDRDKRLSREEFIEQGTYLTKRARTGIFVASDSNRDDVVSESGYIENRFITDEAKDIIGRMDADGSGRVSSKEFLDNSRVSDEQTARQIFRLLDTDKSGDLVTPEYLRVWGAWARAGRKRKMAGGGPQRLSSELMNLPEISGFEKNPTDRFVVDLATVRTGHPYKGTNANQPHTGAHIYFRVPDEPIPARDVQSFPAIYAVADGFISRVDEYFRQRESFSRTLGRPVANCRYGVSLSIAVNDDAAVNFHYSIEPMIDPEDLEFYRPFILVKRGQRVKKGDVIARMYLPPQADFARNAHIHFNLVDTGQRQFMAPTIFTKRINQQFHATWGSRGVDGGDQMPPCMGYCLSAPENPFGTAAKDRL
ncbi:MAG: hypothetical protein P8J37_17660 [Fuerstiella sp.]|nr:hypothetical protein [Fuerstiella sp.]